MSQFFLSGGQSIGISASASVFPMKIQGWFPLGLTGLTALQSKGLSRIFSSITVQNYQILETQLSWASLVAELVKNPPAMHKTWVWSLGWEDLLEKGKVQFSSVAQSCPTLCDTMNRSMPGLPVHHQLLEFTQTHVHQVSDAIQPSHPLSSPSPPAPIPPSIRVFSNESTLRMRCPKYWSFSFSIIPSKEIPGLIYLSIYLYVCIYILLY